MSLLRKDCESHLTPKWQTIAILHRYREWSLASCRLQSMRRFSVFNPPPTVPGVETQKVTRSKTYLLTFPLWRAALLRGRKASEPWRGASNLRWDIFATVFEGAGCRPVSSR